MDKIQISILKILDKTRDIIGSRELAKLLKDHGIEISERTVRYHLRILDARGFTTVLGKKGHAITELGRRELEVALIFERALFVSSKIDTLSYLTSFDPEKGSGEVVVNISLLPATQARELFPIIYQVYMSGYSMGSRLKIYKSGEHIGSIEIPQDKVGIATICSITINGIFLSHGIPVISRFGGILEVKDYKPTRFTALINYEGSSLDPHELFIKAKMTDVLGLLKKGSGAILASYREIPAVALTQVRILTNRLKELGISGIIQIGEPNRPILGINPTLDKVGLVIAGGLNPIAALGEMGIDVENTAMATLIQYDQLQEVAVLMTQQM